MLLHMSLKWGNTLVSNNGPRIPSFALETIVETYYQRKISLAIEAYFFQMNSVLQSFPKGIPATEFTSADSIAKTMALSTLGTRHNPLGNGQDFNFYKCQLQTRLVQLFQVFLTKNEANIRVYQAIQAAEKAKVAVEHEGAQRITLAQKIVDRARNEMRLASHNLQVSQAALADAQRILSERQHEFQAALKDLEIAKSSS